MAGAPFVFLHLTDLHVTAEGAPLLYGLDPGARLAAAIDDIGRRHGSGSAMPAAFAVITGDLTHEGDAAAYLRLSRLLDGLVCPVHLLIGNHDDRETFRRVFPEAPCDGSGFVQTALDTPVGRFLLLDTNEPGTAAGRLCRARLDWLAARLAEDGGPVFLFLHHPPFRVGIEAMDRIMLLDADALWEVLAPHRARVRHLFHGHLHRPLAGSWHGIPTSSLRGLSHQVALDFGPRPRVPGSHEPPAYAIVRAEADALIVHAHDFLDGTASFEL